MNEMQIERTIEVLAMISKDMADDAKNLDGKPFNGITVAEHFGKQGAAIAALADIMKFTIEKIKGAII